MFSVTEFIYKSDPISFGLFDFVYIIIIFILLWFIFEMIDCNYEGNK